MCSGKGDINMWERIPKAGYSTKMKMIGDIGLITRSNMWQFAWHGWSSNWVVEGHIMIDVKVIAIWGERFKWFDKHQDGGL